MPLRVLPHAGRDAHDCRDMLSENVEPQLRPWVAETDDVGEDRVMLAIQYATAIIAALAAGFLSLVR